MKYPLVPHFLSNFSGAYIARVNDNLSCCAKFSGVVVVYVFVSEAGDALRRNRVRPGRERVPDVAIFTVRKRLELPTLAEGFDRLFAVKMNERERTFEVHPIQ